MIASQTDQLAETQSAIAKRLGFAPGDDDMEPASVPAVISNGAAADRSVTLQRQQASHKNYSIPTDHVWPATEELPPDQREAIRWLHTYAVENDLSVKELGNRLRRGNSEPYSGNTIYKVITGKHEADLVNITKSIQAFRAVIEERSNMRQQPFIETRLSRRLFQIFEAARIYQKIILVYSDSQVGKTEASEEFARRHPTYCRYARMNAGGSLREFVSTCVEDTNINLGSSISAMRRRFVRCFSQDMVFIVDEFHQAFVRRFMLETIELIREVYDRSKCGVVLVSTKIVADEILRGKHNALLRQLDRRCLVKVELPAAPAKHDLNIFAESYGLPPATGEALTLQTNTIRDQGLGVWCTYLKAGSRVAGKSKRPMRWEHVIEAHAGLMKLQQIKDLD